MWEQKVVGNWLHYELRMIRMMNAVDGEKGCSAADRGRSRSLMPFFVQQSLDQVTSVVDTIAPNWPRLLSSENAMTTPSAEPHTPANF